MKRIELILAALAVCFLSGCGNSSLETSFVSQSEKIDSYVSKQMESHPEYRAVYKDGVVRMIVSEGEGEELETGGTVSFYYAGYNFNNATATASTMFATNDADIAAAAKWNLSDSTLFQPMTVTLGKDPLVKGLEIGLEGVKTGEDSYILFSGRHGFGKHALGTIPANAALCYHVRVEEVTR